MGLGKAPQPTGANGARGEGQPGQRRQSDEGQMSEAARFLGSVTESRDVEVRLPPASWSPEAFLVLFSSFQREAEKGAVYGLCELRYVRYLMKLFGK